mgnify:CR=1 FL=1
MTEYSTDRRTFMGGLAATSLFGLPAAEGAMPPGAIDPALFEQGSSELRLTITDVPTATWDKDYVEVYAWAWDFSVPTDQQGQPVIGAINVVKTVDQSTPVLMNSLVNNVQHDAAVLSLFTDASKTGRAEETLRIEMGDVYLISLLDEGRPDFGLHPESLALRFREVTVRHPVSGNEFHWSALSE